jgi:hypothetical protein
MVMPRQCAHHPSMSPPLDHGTFVRAAEEEYARTIARAAEKCGEAVLAERLGVPAAALRSWIDGTRATPVSAFLFALDVLAELE